MNSTRCRLLGIFVIGLLLIPFAAAAAPPGNEHFEHVWARVDRPVAEQVVSRTWMWGPSATTGLMSEPYTAAPNGFRTVQYFDKSRMEITNPDGDAESLWYVTNGLLAKEMITGRMQVGGTEFFEVGPADVRVAGDAHPDTPTYATLSTLLDTSPRQLESVITERLDASGETTNDPALADYGVTVAYHVPETNHTIAGPFWEFMNRTGTVFESGSYVSGRLFENPFFATGFPITEGYWVHVPVGGKWQDVLLQCFERRCLTFTPGNPDGWQVEAGNVGRHYHEFRYGRPPDAVDCIDLNIATHQDLQQLVNVGPTRAVDIMEARPYESVEDLVNANGIGPVTLEQIIEQGLACVEYAPQGANAFHQSR